MLIFHIIIALSSLGVSGITYFKPTKQKLNITYVLVALTLITGTYLAVLTPAHIVSSCMTGLVYLAIVLPAIALTHKKLYKKV